MDALFGHAGHQRQHRGCAVERLDLHIGLNHRIRPNIQFAIFIRSRSFRPACRLLGNVSARPRSAHLRPSEATLGIGAGHGCDRRRPAAVLHEREANDRHTTKVALLDEQTGRERTLLPKPTTRPELSWERVGDIDNIIFVQGARAAVAARRARCTLPSL